MKNFQKNLQKLEATDTQVLGVSMDSPFSNKAFADQIGVTFPAERLGWRHNPQVRRLRRQIQSHTPHKFSNRKGRKNPRGANRQLRHRPHENSGRMRAPQAEKLTLRSDGCYDGCAGWSSLVARWAHNPKVGGSNPPPATKIILKIKQLKGSLKIGSLLFCSTMRELCGFH